MVFRGDQMIETIISNFHLEKILWIVKKKIAYMIIFAAVGGCAMGGYAYMTNENRYQAVISFYVYGNRDYLYDSSTTMSNSDFTLAKNLVPSYTRVLRSHTVLEMVIEETNLPYTPEQLSSMIGYSVVENTAIFTVWVYDSNPYNAMALANAIADIAPAEIARIVKTGGVEVVDYAKLPTRPYSSRNMMKFALLGVAGGGGLSAMAFLFFGLLDTTIRRKYELRLTFTIPILGEVPLMTSANGKKEKPDMVLKENSPFAVKECYGTIRTNMMFLGRGEKCPVYTVTSAEQNAGKTLNSINLAITYAGLGKRVLLIDGDMRKPSIDKALKLKADDGLSEYLAGITSEISICSYSKQLDIILAGQVPPNASELLAGDAMENFLRVMKQRYDCIIIDLPPVGIVSDGLVLAQNVTTYILVVRMGESRLNVVKNSVLALEQVGANVGGFVFNGISLKSQDYNYRKYGRDSGYGYGKEEQHC